MRLVRGDVFDPSGLEPGHRNIALRNWLLLLAALLWPIAIAVSRLRFASGPDAVGESFKRLGRVGAVADAVRNSRPGRRSAVADARPERAPTGQVPGSGSTSSPSTRTPVAASPTKGASSDDGSTLASLLADKRERRRSSDSTESSKE